MRYLILSDIHANWEALQAAVAAASEEGWDEVVCLGDIVGYGADPNRCVEWVRENSRYVIRGNHDKACVGLEDLEWFNPVASRACRWTQTELSSEAADWLRQLPLGPMPAGSNGDRFTISHGSPVDEDQYVVNLDEAAQIEGYLEQSVTFFGHTHLQGGFEYAAGVQRIPGVPAADEGVSVSLEPLARYMINPGSVGQPRDGDPRAAWAVYDPEAGTVTYRRVFYDLHSAQAKILAAGLPEVLAFRLSIGH
ncbi:MAG: metallophosphoesterase family protein [Bryobacteraceae bacterium]